MAQERSKTLIFNLGFLNDAIPFVELNETLITLIPKIKNPEDMVDFRYISLCNLVYKILSKMLVNRIKPVLESVVGDEQSAFISNRLIADNIIIASEVFHWLNSRRRRDCKEAYVVKIDMSKAYDKIE